MTQQNPTLLDQLERWTDGTLPDDQLDQLTANLESAEARSLLVDHWLLERALPETLSQHTIRSQNPVFLAQEPPRTIEDSIVRPRPAIWRTLGAAAAGLAVGLFGASLVFAKVSLSQSSVAKKQTLLLQEDFESDKAPQTLGLPKAQDTWSGDYSKLVPSRLDVLPRSGRQMLQLLRADHQGKALKPSYSADLYRYIPIPAAESSGQTHESAAAFEAHFRVAATPQARSYAACLWIHALDSIPSASAPPNEWMSIEDLTVTPSEASRITASTRRSLSIHPSSSDWQKLRVEMNLPQHTRSLLISLHVAEIRNPRTDPVDSPAEFPGVFIDDLQISLLRDQAAP
jgi:hypothetical protein